MFFPVRTLGFGIRVLLSFRIQILTFQICLSRYQLAPDCTKRELPFGDLLFHLLLPAHEQKMVLEQRNSDSIKNGFLFASQHSYLESFKFPIDVI